MLGRWALPPVERLLKTDLFDEAVAAGIYPILARSAARVTAIDVSTRAAALARRRYPALEAVVCDVRAMPFADREFDAVVSNSTLDHFATSDAIHAGLREIARVLRPGGRLLVSLDNPGNPLVALRNALPAEPLRRTRLVPYYVGATQGRGALAAALESAGFSVARLTAVMHVPRVAARAAAPLLDDRMIPRAARSLARLEALERLPTRFLTGQFVVAHAVRADDRGRTG